MKRKGYTIGLKRTTDQNETQINGVITAIKYRNETGWCVFSVAGDHDQTETNCTGTLPDIADQGTECKCVGKFESNKFGMSLKCREITIAPPRTDTAAGVAKLLTRLPGVGPAKAKSAIDEYGPEYAWFVAQNCPSMLGISNVMDAEIAIEIASSLIQNYETLTYLMGIGLTDFQAGQIIKQFKADARRVVAENPYDLLQIDGFGFRTVDVIALKAGVKQNAMARIMACILYCLESSEKNDGHIWFWGKDLAGIVADDLKEGALKMSLPMFDQPTYEDIKKATYALQDTEKVFIDGGKVYSANLLQDEQDILKTIAII